MSREHISGSLLGGAVGDAIGLPYEGLARRRAARMLGPPDRHRLLPGRGMVSDDTEHACMVARALIASGGDARRFQHHLAAQLAERGLLRRQRSRHARADPRPAALLKHAVRVLGRRAPDPAGDGIDGASSQDRDGEDGAEPAHAFNRSRAEPLSRSDSPR